jgi:uncharacterized peroxidase-related enzyme
MLVEKIARGDWQKAGLTAADEALCAFAERLTKSPEGMGQEDVDALRAHGFDDTAIHDTAQVVGYFNYINRIADALGVDLEDFVRAWGEENGK